MEDGYDKAWISWIFVAVLLSPACVPQGYDLVPMIDCSPSRNPWYQPGIPKPGLHHSRTCFTREMFLPGVVFGRTENRVCDRSVGPVQSLEGALCRRPPCSSCRAIAIRVYPKEAAQQVVDILKKQGLTVDLHYYANEGHGFVKRENQIDSVRRTPAWFAVSKAHGSSSYRASHRPPAMRRKNHDRSVPTLKLASHLIFRGCQCSTAPTGT